MPPVTVRVGDYVSRPFGLARVERISIDGYTVRDITCDMAGNPVIGELEWCVPFNERPRPVTDAQSVLACQNLDLAEAAQRSADEIVRILEYRRATPFEHHESLYEGLRDAYGDLTRAEARIAANKVVMAQLRHVALAKNGGVGWWLTPGSQEADSEAFSAPQAAKSGSAGGQCPDNETPPWDEPRCAQSQSVGAEAPFAGAAKSARSPIWIVASLGASQAPQTGEARSWPQECPGDKGFPSAAPDAPSGFVSEMEALLAAAKTLEPIAQREVARGIASTINGHYGQTAA
jgi:hypothetical protein